jgi:hypothetical protein
MNRDSFPRRSKRLFTTMSIPASRAYSAFHPVVMKTVSRVFEADHSPPPSGEVKNAWNYTSAPPYEGGLISLWFYKENNKLWD